MKQLKPIYGITVGLKEIKAFRNCMCLERISSEVSVVITVKRNVGVCLKVDQAACFVTATDHYSRTIVRVGAPRGSGIVGGRRYILLESTCFLLCSLPCLVLTGLHLAASCTGRLITLYGWSVVQVDLRQSEVVTGVIRVLFCV